MAITKIPDKNAAEEAVDEDEYYYITDDEGESDVSIYENDQTCQPNLTESRIDEIGASNKITNLNEDIKRVLIPKDDFPAKEDLFVRNKVWIPDLNLGFRMCSIVSEDPKNRTVTVKINNEHKETQEIKTIDKNYVLAVDKSHYSSDMCDLIEINEASILHTISCRYESRIIHTRSGPFCICVNPWQTIPELYSEEMIEFYSSQSTYCGSRDNTFPPHIYSMARNAYDGIIGLNGKSEDQTILITGESGAGKTENTKRIIEFLISLANKNRNDASAYGTAPVERHQSIDSAILEANVALEAFANAKTVHNNNSSRMGKFIRINFDESGRLMSAEIDCYLLEKSRIVSQNPGDRNFHIFYQLLSNKNILASSDPLLNDIFTNETHLCWKNFRYLNQGFVNKNNFEDIHDKFVDDFFTGQQTENSLNKLGFTKEKSWIREIIISCILIGEIRFNERRGLDLCYVEEMTAMNAVTQLLGLDHSRGQHTVSPCLMNALTQPTMIIGETLVRKNQSLRKTLFSAAALVKMLYERLFRWILCKCNTFANRNADYMLSHPNKNIRFIGVLDMAGFEVISRNSFEQLCINYTNEKLQHFFNEFMFLREMQEMEAEGIHWDQSDFDLNLIPIISLFENPTGIFGLLQDECLVPNGSDNSLLEKLCKYCTYFNSPFNVVKQSARTITNNHFSINHYAGSVSYNVEGWVEKNRDAIDLCILELLATSKHPLVSQLFAPDIGITKHRRGLSTISHVYREQLTELVRTLKKTFPHFIRCIVPNYKRLPFCIDRPLVLKQLRCNGVLEGIRIYKQGFPNRLLLSEFVQRYRIVLIGETSTSALRDINANSSNFSREILSIICKHLNLGKERIQIGKNKVFCRAGLISELETRRYNCLSTIFSKLQACMRWYLQQKLYRQKYEECEAIITIQTAVKHKISLFDWNWFKIWNQVRNFKRLLNERRIFEELKEECESLRRTKQRLEAKIERLEHSEHSLILKIQKMESQYEEEREEAVELRAELLRNEEILEVIEKRFDEQHTKVMRLNSNLKENIQSLERVEEEKKLIQRDFDKVNEKYRLECIERKSAENHLEMIQEENIQLNREFKSLSIEFDRLRGKLVEEERENLELREQNSVQETEILVLKQMLEDANDKVNALQPQLRRERTARQRAELEADELSTELEHVKEELTKTNSQRESMAEQLRSKEEFIVKLEHELEKKTEAMEDCINELKNVHKKFQNDLRNQMDDYRRKALKLETENVQLKCRIKETDNSGQVCQTYSFSVERDSSVDSDHGMNLNSMPRSSSKEHFSYTTDNANNLNHGRKKRERPQSTISRSTSNNILTATESLQQQYPSLTVNNIMVSSLTTTTDSGLTRCSSTSSTGSSWKHREQQEQATTSSSVSVYSQELQIFRKLESSERKSQQLEKENHSLRQDSQLSKRELDVYKQSFQELERTKDTLSKQVKTLNAEVEKLSRVLKAKEKHSQEITFELQRKTNECLTLQQKFKEEKEESETKMEDLKKRHQAKLEELKCDYELMLKHSKNVYKNFEELQMKLEATESDLQKALSHVSHLERFQKSHVSIGENWEANYREAQQEIQSLRDENASLKSKIRRQIKQIELLTCLFSLWIIVYKIF